MPISYHGRTYEEGKKIGWKDGVRALYAIFKYAVKSSPSAKTLAAPAPRDWPPAPRRRQRRAPPAPKGTEQAVADDPRSAYSGMVAWMTLRALAP